MNYFKDLEYKIKPEHHAIYRFASHVRQEMDDMYEKHVLETGVRAISKEKINGEVEAAIRETYHTMQELIVKVLEKTIEDEQYTSKEEQMKNFRDGID